MLLARVRVGDNDNSKDGAWISKTGGEETSDGGIVFPKATGWGAPAYDKQPAKGGEKSSSTPGMIPASFKLRHNQHTIKMSLA